MVLLFKDCRLGFRRIQKFSEGGRGISIDRLIGNRIEERFVANSKLGYLSVGSNPALLDSTAMVKRGR